MTQTQSPSDGYARSNWWGDIDDPDDSGHRHPVSGPCPDYEFDLAAWKAHKFLKDGGELVSPVTKFAPPNRPDCAVWTPAFALIFDDEHIAHDPAALHTENFDAAMSEPVVFVPKRHDGPGRSFDYRQQSHRSRYDELGHLCGPVIRDRPMEAFLTVVREWLRLRAYRRGEAVATLDDRHQILRDARRMKMSGEYRDTEILAQLIREARQRHNST